MYYQRTDVKNAILSQAFSERGAREVAIFNSATKSFQRYFKDGGKKIPIEINERTYNEIARNASAFYCSYWHYDSFDFSTPIGRDLVWVVRTREGGISVAKSITKMVCEALEEMGITPLVKYSGELGFDIVIPFDLIPPQISSGGLEALDEFHHQLTDQMVSYIRKKLPEAEIREMKGTVLLRIGSNSCLLSELRARRGLLLAPMSLNPKTGLVSLPVDPAKLDSFNPLHASPQLARAAEWKAQMPIAMALLRVAVGASTVATSS